MTCTAMLLVFGAINLHLVAAQVNVSPTYSNNQDPSLITLSSVSNPSSGDLNLVLLPGTHNIRSLSISRAESITLIGTAGETNVECSALRYGYNLRFTGAANITIKNIHFIGCNLEIIRSNNTEITQSEFTDSNSVLEFSTCFNITINNCTFEDNRGSSFYGVIKFTNSKGIEVTRSNFTNNTASSHSGIVCFDRSTGFISCSNFHNNSVGSFCGIVKVESRSIIINNIIITNSTFTKNSVSSFGGIILIDSYSNGEYVTVISCVFQFNTARSFGGVINVDTRIARVTILASDFSHNRAGSFGGTINNQDSNRHVYIDCTSFSNTSANYRVERTSIQNSTSCSEVFAIGELGICKDNTYNCEGN